jgi:hypothetical protein
VKNYPNPIIPSRKNKRCEVDEQMSFSYVRGGETKRYILADPLMLGAIPRSVQNKMRACEEDGERGKVLK